MSYVLPEIREDKYLEFPWFPTSAQCVVYRNWGSVEPHRIAKALDTDVATVMEMAGKMGLDTNISVPQEWNTRGYITIIRNNWHLLSYEKICDLLDWTEEHLAFILREDDFLDVKLGRFKPKTPNIKIVPLTDEQKVRTDEIKKITESLRMISPSTIAKPFDFFSELPQDVTISKNSDDFIFEDRIVYSYCALYGDLFLSKELIDISFPDKMLEKYQEYGINGIWTQGVLSTLAPYPFDEIASKDCDRRIEGVNYLISKLERYGIGLYIYFNEPRALPIESFADKGNIKGAVRNGLACLCSSNDVVKKYLFDSVKYFVERAPKLSGIFTITASENLTHCYSHFGEGKTTCPRCKVRSKASVIGEVNKIICNAAKSANANIKIFAFTWGWEKLEEVIANCDVMPKDISLMCVSEYDVHKTIQGEETSVIDYSISVDGPGEVSKTVWDFAKKDGRKCIAKIQINNTWELSTVPLIPVFNKFYDHIKRLAELGTVDSLFLTWTLGGYPSPALKLLNYFKKERIPTLEEILKDMFPNADIDKVSSAFKMLSDAFDKYPFSLRGVYRGAQQLGPANFIYPESTGFESTMTGYPYDDLDNWKGSFSLNAYKKAWKQMCDDWNCGVEMLMEIDCKSEDMRFILECAKACYIHFISVLNQIDFLIETKKMKKIAILEAEEENAVKMIRLVDKNSTFGYEASNHYFYTRQSLFEKVINCRYVKSKICYEK